MNTRFMGVDYGAKFVGIAFSDEEGMMAFPFSVFPNTKDLEEKIEALCREKSVGGIVIGESKDFSGKENPIQKDIITLKEGLEGRGFSVSLEPEFLTSAQARRLGGAGLSRKGRENHNDASAAALILQGYLDRKHKLGNK